MKPHLSRLLVALAITAMSWLSPATRASPAASAPAAASRNVDDCIATLAGRYWTVAEGDIEQIQTLADAFPLSDERLAQLLDLATAKRIPEAFLDRLAAAVHTRDGAALPRDQLVFLRAVATGASLPLIRDRLADPDLRASATLGANLADSPFPGSAQQAQQAAVLVAFLDECHATGVQEVWSAGPRGRWRRQPFLDAALDRLWSLGQMPHMARQALVFAAFDRPRATIELAMAFEAQTSFLDASVRAVQLRVAALLYEKWNKNPPSYRLLRWLAAHLPGSGRPRLFLGMAVVALAFHLLQLPILVKTRQSMMDDSPRALWLTGALTFTQLLPVVWAIAIGPAWVFAFQEGRTSFGEAAMSIVVALGVILVVVLPLRLAHAAEQKKPLRRIEVVAMLGGLVLAAVAGTLLGLRAGELLNGVGLDVAAFMMITGPVPLAIYVGLLLRRRRMAGTT